MSDSSYACAHRQPEGDRGSCSRSSPITSNRPLSRRCREGPRVVLHLLHDVGVTLAAQADEVVVLRQHHRGARGEVQRERGVGLAEIVLVEDQVLGEVGLLPEDQPADARIDQPVLVSRDIDRTHLLEPEVPLRLGIEERPHETAAGAVDVHRDVQVPLPLDIQHSSLMPTTSSLCPVKWCRARQRRRWCSRRDRLRRRRGRSCTCPRPAARSVARRRSSGRTSPTPRGIRHRRRGSAGRS